MLGRAVAGPEGQQLGHVSDVLARLLSGLRVSFEVVILVKAINVTLGVALGLLSGYCRGWVNGVLGRVCDILMTFPGILLAILLAALLPTPLPGRIPLVISISKPSGSGTFSNKASKAAPATLRAGSVGRL